MGDGLPQAVRSHSLEAEHEGRSNCASSLHAVLICPNYVVLAASPRGFDLRSVCEIRNVDIDVCWASLSRHLLHGSELYSAVCPAADAGVAEGFNRWQASLQAQACAVPKGLCLRLYCMSPNLDERPGSLERVLRLSCSARHSRQPFASASAWCLLLLLHTSLWLLRLTTSKGADRQLSKNVTSLGC
jgi:hypothetical protein